MVVVWNFTRQKKAHGLAVGDTIQVKATAGANAGKVAKLNNASSDNS